MLELYVNLVYDLRHADLLSKAMEIITLHGAAIYSLVLRKPDRAG